MSLYQNSVLKTYLAQQDNEVVTKAYKKFIKYFHNPTIQQNIRERKEEQFQEGFLIELFVNVFDYTLAPNPKFNLTTEFKNEKGAKKADGAILKDKKALGVIELKSTKVKDLEKIRQQAFDYKANQTGCIYVVTSNFEKLRFYINNAVEYEEFDLFTLTDERFQLMYLCLANDNILNNLPLAIKQASIQEEKKITDDFYKDYSLFKRELFRDLVKQNMKNEVFRTELNNEDIDRGTKNIKRTLFKKSQKLIDRFLFIFFAEDSTLLTSNSAKKMLDKWKADNDFGDERPLYDLFKQYFHFLDTGRKGTGSRAEIFAYNGGLFKLDPVLDSLIIDSNLLNTHIDTLQTYDFESQVDVNILGHIFENSLNEIEGTDFDKQKTKRKKDGVFYTPKYITKYIVDNTVGKLCTEKKEEFGISNIDTSKNYLLKERRTVEQEIQVQTGQGIISTVKKIKTNVSVEGYKLIKKIEAYRSWLLQIAICDPACGSGAFLNQALDFLIKEHGGIDELMIIIQGRSMVFPNIENTVLENNIFGVDLNEESIEIAKLSLWLRTAQPRRKLNDLSSNIKCGNSLIDNKAVAGDKAFKWEEEFPKVFKEKDKKAWHITTATHDSRTSQRMIDYKVRELRDNGTRPKAYPIWLEPEDELLITETVAQIVEEDQLNVMAYNICGDHLHILLVCEEEKVSKIVGKIKAITSKEYNTAIGITTREHVPLSKEEKKSYNSLWTQKFGCKEIKDKKQLWNTVTYIKTNREKHELPSLPNNNKGISALALIENMSSSYEDAFHIEKKGGFDVVIGNPPYVFARDNISDELKDYYTKNYVSAEYQVNTYLLFIEQTIKLIRDTANYGLIIPNAWLMVGSATGLRNFILQNCSISEIINLAGYSFEGVNVETIIILATKTKQKQENNSIKVLLSDDKEFRYSHDRKQLDFENNEGFEFKVFSDETSVALTKKLKNNSKNLDDLVLIKAGLQAYEKNKGEPKQTIEDVKNRPFDYTYKFDENTHKYLEGKDVGRYFTNWSGQYLQYGKHLASPRTFNLFDGEKLIIREITGKFPNSIISTYSEDLYLYNRSNIAIVKREELNISLKYVVAILNSQLMAYYFVKNTAKSVRRMFPKIILNDLRKFPFKEISKSEQQPFIDKAEIILTLNENLQNVSTKFIGLLQSELFIEKVTKKIENWHTLEWGDFEKELKRIKIVLMGEQKEDWFERFNRLKTEAQHIKTEIDKTDSDIDAMVYELYGLSEEEIKIVEEN